MILMTNPVFNPDDPRLTAFVLGELDETGRTEIEKLIAGSPEAAAAAQELVETVGVLSGELASEPAPKLTATQRAAILDLGTSNQTPAMTDSTAETESTGTSLPEARADSGTSGHGEAPSAARRFPWAVSGSLMASVAVLLAVASQFPTTSSDVTGLAGRPQMESGASTNADSEQLGNADLAQSDWHMTNSNIKGQPELEEGQVLSIVQNSELMKPQGTAGEEFAKETYGGGSERQALASLPAPGGSTPSAGRARTEGSQNTQGEQAAGGMAENHPAPHPFTGVSRRGPGSDKPASAQSQRSKMLTKLTESKDGKRAFSQADTKPSLETTAAVPADALRISSDERSVDDTVHTHSRDQESYAPITENEFVEPRTVEQRLSTFSVDVDTASYTNVRRFLNNGQLPPADAVRIEELINYFDYDYTGPEGNQPFSINVELNRCPWAVSHRLARIGIKARTIDKTKRPPTSLVFMIDVSGSMRSSGKLPLVKQSIQMLVNELTEDDQVAVVAYASNAGLRLDATSGSEHEDIMQIVNELTAGGSTNGEGGIRTAYDTAVKHFIQGGSNRVIMCTDGDFNVGVDSDSELVTLIEEKAASGVFLSIFGFGMGNLKDSKLEKLADRGNGQYGYIDNLREARKVFTDGLMGTLYTVAKDVKVQVEFNPETVGAYRLIGYENRKLAARDFHDDSKDAGEIGAGHTVTALYEIVPKSTWDRRPAPDTGTLRYRKNADSRQAADGKSEKQLTFADELFFINMNYKHPDRETSTTSPSLHIPVKDIPVSGRVQAPSQDFLWAASVASFGMQLRNSRYRGTWTVADVLETVEGTQSDDELRREFVDLVRKARSLIGPAPLLRRPEIPQAELAPAAELTPAEARRKASLNNKYRRLQKKIEVPGDLQSFGGFYEYGIWEGRAYAGHTGLPSGYWVYVYPSWYIWGEEVPADDGAEPQSPPGKSQPSGSDNQTSN